MDAAREMALERYDLHCTHGNGTPRFYDDPLVEDTIGIAGELAFATQFGLRVDETLRPGGDKGIDFIVPGVGSIDVKTARKPYNLLVKRGHVEANIYVLARYGQGRVTFLGWAFGAEMLRRPARDFGHGIVSHYLAAGELRPMAELLHMIETAGV